RGECCYCGEFIDHWTFQGVVHRIIHRNNNTHRGLSENDMKYFDLADCLECHGGRLNSKSLEVLINRKNIGEVANMSLIDCLNFIKTIQHKNAQVIKPRLVSQLESLVKVGVDYLSLNRSADTLSGGEAQRVKMARQLGCDLVETVYVLDEPTAGLHPRDVEGVIKNLRKLQNKGNTVIIVEHDREVINNADYLIELGPGGGKNGGKVIAQGTLNEVLRNKNSITAKYLRENIRCHSRENGNLLNKQAWSLRNSYYIDSPVKPENDKVREPADCLVIKNARLHNLKNLNVRLPLGDLIALTGVSGSGKSSLVEEILRQHQDRVGLVDQSPIGATKRGCIATYIGVFDRIRRIFSQETGMNASFFSFNSFGGCQQCKGVGFIEMDMNFLGDVKIKCENCGGKRYKENVLQYKFYGKDIAEVLNMTALDVKDFFDDFEIKRAMDMLIDVGLDYLEMGQTLDTLSGGESQRLKLASKLQSKGDFIILDEPTSGLHFADVEKLLRLLNRLVNNGNTILVVEHNLDVIKNCDWIIDLGPGGGEKGGEIVAQGKLENIIKCKKSYTGKYLQKLL
ncbi:MAG: ATP-binding cassette domain-containing protein, partial [Patescibacteria group bacterium]|nr:ATP-binding cassette domain-containing protein [Patescibacteria group bacterium]